MDGDEAMSVVLEAWDQRKSLQPPPYQGAMRPMLEGLTKGDDLIDALPESLISPCGWKKHPLPLLDVPQSSDPPWVDWEKVRRGQELWRQQIGRAFLALTAALLQGFTIARFADVLHHAGYAQSPWTSCKRYSSTAFFISDWFRYPLDDPNSIARQGIYMVRCMHSFARRRSKSLFSQERGEGIALSQYDLGEVQLGFTAVCLSIMEVELGMAPFSDADKEAMVHTWRIVGWHLGIEDQFNVCQSSQHLAECLDDYMTWTPQRLRTCRESTHVLQLAAVRGFGKHLGLGEHYWRGFLSTLQNLRGQDIKYSRIEALPGMASFVRLRFAIVGKSDMINSILNRFIFFMRDWSRHKPELYEKYLKSVAPLLADIHDVFIWRVVAILARCGFDFEHSQFRGMVILLVCTVMLYYRCWKGRRLA